MHSHCKAYQNHWHRKVALFISALMLVWSFATIAHQLDVTPEHHTDHHCQLFSGLQHGTLKSLPILTPPSFHRSYFVDSQQKRQQVTSLLPSARDPPLMLNI
ncbi:DUF2607 family protein [Vibrio sagamiensis]|uniref:DUF2607 family protein n=1 Tax=Vibrio sagamiensis TaxID=512650 RepID=UPI000587739B|nr:DUF2607 family protein [Vibrio sagamiensis]PNQ70796.1 DUF2607 domain-containing protein [Vibrio agarivorans]